MPSTRLEVRAVRRVLFDRHGGEARGAIVCDLRAGDGTCWRVMTTHLDLHSRHRRRQFATLLDELVPTARQPTVLMGDFNEWSTRSRALTALRRHAELPPAPRTFPSCCRSAPGSYRFVGLPAAGRDPTPSDAPHAARLRSSADFRGPGRGKSVAAVATSGEVRADALPADAP